MVSRASVIGVSPIQCLDPFFLEEQLLLGKHAVTEVNAMSIVLGCGQDECRCIERSRVEVQNASPLSWPCMFLFNRVCSHFHDGKLCRIDQPGERDKDAEQRRSHFAEVVVGEREIDRIRLEIDVAERRLEINERLLQPFRLRVQDPANEFSRRWQIKLLHG